jgi:hypothetical protein
MLWTVSADRFAEKFHGAVWQARTKGDLTGKWQVFSGSSDFRLSRMAPILDSVSESPGGY